MVLKRRYILFVEVETGREWEEPDYYLHLALKTMRKMGRDLGDLDIVFDHAIEVRDRGLYNLFYELLTKIVYGKKVKKPKTRKRTTRSGGQ